MTLQDALTDYAALCDLWAEANALGTVLGDRERLMTKIGKLRDTFGNRRAALHPSEHPKLGVHLSHCNFGEHAGNCKYGDDDCPAMTPAWRWFGDRLQHLAAENERLRQLHPSEAAPVLNAGAETNSVQSDQAKRDGDTAAPRFWIGMHVVALKKMVIDMRDDGLGIELCARAGDKLVILSGNGQPYWFVSHHENRKTTFGVREDEIAPASSVWNGRLSVEPVAPIELDDYQALRDIWAEANALGTVLGDRERLMTKVAKLRDAFGQRQVAAPQPPIQPEPNVQRSSTAALERLRSNFQLLLSGKPVRDVAETLAEVDAALRASQGTKQP